METLAMRREYGILGYSGRSKDAGKRGSGTVDPIGDMRGNRQEGVNTET
jgi:hypothetical protein